MNTFMIHANIEFLKFWNFLISETYSFLEHFRSSIKIYRSYQVISSMKNIAKAKSMKRIQNGKTRSTVIEQYLSIPFNFLSM